jgi:hypothetical protein
MPSNKIIDGYWTPTHIWEIPNKTPVYYCENHAPNGARPMTANERREHYGKAGCPRCSRNLEKLRNQYRSTVCSGCRYNYYNFPKGQSANGDVEVVETYGCWHLSGITRGKCSIHD